MFADRTDVSPAPEGRQNKAQGDAQRSGALGSPASQHPSPRRGRQKDRQDPTCRNRNATSSTTSCSRPKVANPGLHGDVRSRVHQYIGGVIRRQGGVPLIVNGTSDHVHILAKLAQDKALSNVLRDIKSNSSTGIHRTFPDLQGFQWQAGYGAITVSTSHTETLRRYIVRQEEHHRKLSFKDELVRLLRAHGIACDERHM